MPIGTVFAETVTYTNTWMVIWSTIIIYGPISTYYSNRAYTSKPTIFSYMYTTTHYLIICSSCIILPLFNSYICRKFLRDNFSHKKYFKDPSTGIVYGKNWENKFSGRGKRSMKAANYYPCRSPAIQLLPSHSHTQVLSSAHINNWCSRRQFSKLYALQVAMAHKCLPKIISWYLWHRNDLQEK